MVTTSLLVLACQTTPRSLIENTTALFSSEPKPVSGNAIPLPTYTVGDHFRYDDGRSDKVVKVEGDWVYWQKSNGFKWKTHRDFVLPNKEWESRTKIGGLTFTSHPYGSLWPLEPGNNLWYSYRSTSKIKGDSFGKQGKSKWKCKVNPVENTQVKSGTYLTYPIHCYKSVKRHRTWYYAPDVGHYILKVDRYATKDPKRVELSKYKLKMPEVSKVTKALYKSVLQEALQTKPSGATLKKSSQGVVISVMPTRTFKAENGRYCRDYERSLTIKKRSYPAKGTACKEPGGDWVRI